MELLQGILGIQAGFAIWTLLKIILIVAPLMLVVAYLTYAERKVIGYMQLRLGPNRVGPLGLLQPIADAVKLLLKEIILPAKASHALRSAGAIQRYDSAVRCHIGRQPPFRYSAYRWGGGGAT